MKLLFIFAALLLSVASASAQTTLNGTFVETYPITTTTTANGTIACTLPTPTTLACTFSTAIQPNATITIGPIK